MKKLLSKRIGIGSAGLSLIELIISIAILAVVGTAVGGAMFVSSRGYTRGSSEVNVQEEAQIASNLICDWLIDATNVDPDGMGEDPHNPSGPDIFLGVQTVDLSVSGNVFTITHPDSDLGEVKVQIYLDGTDLKYQLEDGTTGVLASNVSKAVFNSTFGKDRNVNFSIDFAVNDRTYHAVTDSTSRNHEFIATSGDASTTPFIEYSIPKVNGEVIAILEPGQENVPGVGNATFSFKATVKNALSPADGTTTFNVDSPSRNNTSISVSPSTDEGESNVWIITVSASKDAVVDSVYTFTATNTYNDIAIAPKSSSSTVTIKIRRDNECEFYTNPLTAGNYSQLPNDYWNPTTGQPGKQDSIYDTQIELGIQNGNQIFGAPYDSGTFGYKDPGNVDFVFKMGSYDINDYVEIVYQNNGCTYYSNGINAGRAATSPTLSIKLKQDLPQDMYVYVIAPHSGYYVNNPASINISSNNKPTAIMYTGGYSYGTGDQAYFDVIKIKKGSNQGVVNVGAGFQRGAPAFRLGQLSDTALADVMSFLNGVNRSNYKHVVSFKYEYTNEHGVVITSEKYVVSITDGSQDPIYWQQWGNADEKFTHIFDCDRAYKIYVDYDLIDLSDGSSVKHYEGNGSINAVEQYVYKQSTDMFVRTGTSGYGSEHDPVIIDKSNMIHGQWSDICNMYVYYESLDCEDRDPYRIDNNNVNVLVEKYDDEHGWQPSSIPNPHGSENWEFGDNTVTIPDQYGNGKTYHVVKFEGSTPETTKEKYVGDFNQNLFPDQAITFITNETTYCQHSDNGLYRITYYTDGNRYKLTGSGSMPTPSNTSGSIYSMEQTTSAKEEIGTVYFELVNF